MRFLALFAASAGSAAAVETASPAMERVIELLAKMKQTVSDETNQGQADRDEHEDWCIKTITELQKDVEYGTLKVEDLSAAAEAGAGEAAAQTADANAAAEAVGKSVSEQKTAKNLREEEAAVFATKQAELVDADNMLVKAHKVLKNALASFLQTGDSEISPDSLSEIVAALGQITASMNVQDTESAGKIAAFVQEASEQPQATVKNYESKSGGILDAIKEMQVKNSAILESLRDAENSSRHAYELLMQDLKTTQENKEKQREAAVENAAKADGAGKASAAKGAETADVLKEDKKELLMTQVECSKAAKDWSERRDDAEKEMSTIQQALDILTGKFGEPEKEEEASFLQTHISGESVSLFKKRQDASDILRSLGRKFQNAALTQLSESAYADPFVKIRGMIGEMIAKMEKVQAEEAGAEMQCRKDKESGKHSLEKANKNFEKLTARQNGSKAKIVTLGEEIADLNQQLQELNQKMAQASQMRNKEAVDNAAVIKDSTESIEAISAAINKLNEVYGIALVQTSTDQPKSDTASVIIQMLQTAQSDFEKLKGDTEFAESKGTKNYEEFMQQSKVSQAKKQAMVQGKTGERSSVKSALAEIDDDLAEATKALDSASGYLKGVNERCKHKEMSYEERVAARESEIAGLREAFQILEDSGKDTGFLQKK